MITETQLVTVTARPGTVTVALQGPAAISSSLSSAFSVESQQLEIDSQLAPNNPLTSGHTLTTTSATRFTRTIVVPVVEATETSSPTGPPPSIDVYFISESNGTTTWLTNFTPEQSMTIGTTTITLSPIPSTSLTSGNSSMPITRATHTNSSTTTINRPGSLLVSLSGGLSGAQYQGWNASTADQATVVTSSGCTNATSSVRTVTIRRSSTITTETKHASTSPTSHALPTDGSGSIVNITFPTATYGDQKRGAVARDLRREVCEWVTATMRGEAVSWRNNWDGSKTVDCLATTTPILGTDETTRRTYSQFSCTAIQLNHASSANIRDRHRHIEKHT